MIDVRVSPTYLWDERLSVLQPAVGGFGLPVGLALPDQPLLDGQSRVSHCLDPLGLRWQIKRAGLRHAGFWMEITAGGTAHRTSEATRHTSNA